MVETKLLLLITKKNMKNKSLTIVTLGLLGAAGCASPSRMTLLPGVGPSPFPASQADAAAVNDGFLQVFSARERIPTISSALEFVRNNDFGNYDLLYADAHTSYSLYGPDGQLLQRVPNATQMNDADPTLVRLSPGSYQVKAECVDFDDVTSTVLVPVCIEPGLTTLVHLDGKWSSAPTGLGDQWVRLSNGSIVGWHCSGSEGGNVALHANNASN